MSPPGQGPKMPGDEDIERTPSYPIKIPRMARQPQPGEVTAAAGAKRHAQLVEWSKVLVVWLTAAGAGIGGGVAAYRFAVGESAERQQKQKNQSEAGYQVTRHAIDEDRAERAALKADVLALRAEVAAIKARTPRPARRVPPVPPVKLVVKPQPLPANLDEAQKVIAKATAGPVPATLAPDASP